MQQKPPKSVQQLYKQICTQLNKPINQALKMGIGDYELIIILEQISHEGNILIILDMEPLNELLSRCKFKSISLRSIQKNLKLNKSMVQDTMKSEILDILKIITKYFSKSLDILSLTIRDIRLTNEPMQVLSQGLAIAQSLKELRLVSCLLTTNQFSILQSALMQNSSLISLDLSHNFLTGPTGILLYSLMQEHSKRRDRVEWVYKTRGEDPEEDISLIGICDMNLSYNKLNDQFVRDLIPFIEKDRWLKSLNLKHNSILKDGIEQLNQVLDKNNTIISLDIRHNLGTTQQISKEIYQKLVRNKTQQRRQLQQQKQYEDGEDNLLANVSAIPNTLQNSQNSYDQESPVMSFGQFDQNNITKQISNLSKQDAFKLKSGVKINESGCGDCTKLSAKLHKSQQIIQLLKQENQWLRTQLQLKQQHQSFNQSQSFYPQSSGNVLNLLDNNQQQNEQDPEQDDMINRIELMMNELTRMMDSLDGQGSATNNLTAHLSSTMLGQNNITRMINERENNEQLINILGPNIQNTSQDQNSSQDTN